MSILVVDDSEDGRDVAEAMLVSAGYPDVTTASSATEAYRFLAIGGPPTLAPSPVDLVLLDIMMPDIDGIEACARIRKEERHSDVPIIMVTALDDTNSLANAFVAGASDYITKPLNRIELLARVRSALKLKSELDRRLARERELLQFVSTIDNRRASQWIDPVTGMFTGELAEAYLTAADNLPANGDTSVIVLAIDRLSSYRTAQGEAVANGIVAQVARAVRSSIATVGVVAAAYGDGMIVVIVPELRPKAVMELAEALRGAVALLGIANPEAIAANHVTASVALVSGRVNRGINCAHLLTRAIANIPRIAAAGGNRVVSERS